MPDWQGRFLTQIDAGCLRAVRRLSTARQLRVEYVFGVVAVSISFLAALSFDLTRKIRDIEPRPELNRQRIHFDDAAASPSGFPE